MTFKKPYIVARRILGPDGVKALRDFSRSMMGDIWAYDACRVQFHSNGTPLKGFDLDNMEYAGERHPHSYGVFLREEVLPRSDELGAKLENMDHMGRFECLSKLVQEARSDGLTWWIMSGAAVRSYLFPGAYSEGKRSDNTNYRYRPKDHQRGKTAELRGLTPDQSEDFTSFATRLTNHRIDPAAVTPLQPIKEQEKEIAYA